MIVTHAHPRVFDVEISKVTNFLLDPGHVDNKGRAKFLAAFGFTASNALTLIQAIIGHSAPGRLTKTYHAPHGIKLHYEDPLISPGGTNPNVRTAWQIDFHGPSDTARFITLKPLNRLTQAPAA